MTPENVLNVVQETIKARRAYYGNPEEMFEKIANRWGHCEDRLTVAMKMADLKMARLRHQWDEDSAIDAIAYLVFAIMFAGADG